MFVIALVVGTPCYWPALHTNDGQRKIVDRFFCFEDPIFGVTYSIFEVEDPIFGVTDRIFEVTDPIFEVTDRIF